MSFVEIEYLNIHFLPPENEPCAIFRWRERNRYLPVWMSVDDALLIEAREADAAPRRPLTHDVLVETLTRLTSGVSEIRIVSYYEGVFIGSIVLNDGEELDVRTSDALAVARIMGLPILADEEVLAQASIFIADGDVEGYLGFPPLSEAEAPAERRDTQADADFEQLMANMGVSEEDLLSADWDDLDDGFDTEDGPDSSER